MADHDDETMAIIAFTISRVYTILVDVCRFLPVPIGLPTNPRIPVSGAAPAIRRVAELAKDQPMEELQRAQLFTGTIHLLAAIDLWRLCSHEFDNHRAEGIAANLVYSEEALINLAEWLIEEGMD